MASSETGGNLRAVPDADPTPDPVRWRILFVQLAAIFMSLIGVSIVNVALPTIRDSLGASQSDLQWVLSGYALTFGVILVAAGRAGDIMGRGGLFLIGVGLFTAASVAAGLAPDADWLNVARFVQGIGSGLLNPQGIGKIQYYFRGNERGRAFGYFGTAVGFSVAIGPVLGGFLIQLGGLVLALVGLGLSILVVILHETSGMSVWWLMATLSLAGLAQGAVISPNQTLTLAEVPLDYAGSSGAIMQTGQRIGTAVGIAVITAATFSALAVASWSTAIGVGFGLISLMIVLALYVSIKDLGSR